MFRSAFARFALGFLLAISLLAPLACGDDDDDNDSAVDDDDDDTAADDDDDDASPEATPIPTTLDQTWIPEPESGEWVMTQGPGEPHLLRDDLAVVPYRNPGDTSRLSMAYFLVFTDLHQTDEESPTRLTFFDANEILDGTFESAFRPQEDLAAHALNALARTANRVQSDYGRDFDLALTLGDNTDNGQYNELRQVVDVFDGNGLASGVPGWTRVDSGDWNLNPETGLDRGERDFGYQDTNPAGDSINAFDRPGYPNSNADIPSAGLRRADGEPLPWFSAIGNHDVEATGTFDPDSALTFYKTDDFVGDYAPFGYVPGLASLVRLWESYPNQPLHVGTGLFGLNMDWRLVFQIGSLVGLIPDSYLADIDPRFDVMAYLHHTPDDGSDDGVIVAADPDRAFMRRAGVINFLHAQGHGFADNNGDGDVDVDDGGYYRVEWNELYPGSNMPLRLLVLDSTEDLTLDDGGFSQDQLDWIADELDEAVIDKVLIIVATHHYLEAIPKKGEEFAALLHSCENVILHLAGHGHDNLVVPRPAEDNDPFFGYWEVETPSNIGFPQQSRIVEVADNRDGTGSIYLTLVDHAPTENDDADALAVLARELAFDDALAVGYYGFDPFAGMGRVFDRNVELVFQIPEDVATKLAGIPAEESITSAEVLTDE